MRESQISNLQISNFEPPGFMVRVALQRSQNLGRRHVAEVAPRDAGIKVAGIKKKPSPNTY